MRIVLAISSMGPGGAERVVSRLSGYWVEQGREVVILALSNTPSFYELNDRVRLVGLDLMSPSESKWVSVVSNFKRVRAMRKAIMDVRPDVIISFMDKTNILVLLATRALAVPVIVSERTFPGSYDPGIEWEMLRKATYRSASCVVAVTEDMRRALEQRGIRNVEVVPNPATANPVCGVQNGSNVVMAAGRLEYLKGFDLLINAFAALQHSHPDWRLVIVGEGELREQLESLAARHGIVDRVRLPGIVGDLTAALPGAEIFVLSSRNEGFPNVLLEAMVAGRAVVAADCRSGPGEMIRHEENGLLVPVDDEGALARALERLMSDPALRRTLGANARKVNETYSLDGVARKWDRIIDEALAA